MKKNGKNSFTLPGNEAARLKLLRMVTMSF